MAYYDYQCDACGPFSEVRPMSQAAEPADCPSCGVPAERAFLTMPYFAGMAADRRLAFATNEKARHEPRRGGTAHGAACSCCTGRTSKNVGSTLYHGDGSKAFPGKRPWMIGH